MNIHYTQTESFNVTLVDTGLNTKTAGRLKRIKKYVGSEPFMLTYGDGVCNINMHELVKFHKDHGKIATVSAIQPEARFGGMELGVDNEVRFLKKNQQGMDSGSMVVILCYHPGFLITWGNRRTISCGKMALGNP